MIRSVDSALVNGAKVHGFCVSLATLKEELFLWRVVAIGTYTDAQVFVEVVVVKLRYTRRGICITVDDFDVDGNFVLGTQAEATMGCRTPM